MSLNGIFVSATDTGVGKTTVAAGLLKLTSLGRLSRYWKPVQTGAESDTFEVARLTGISLSDFPEPLYHFPDPLSPHLAAARVSANICVDTLTRRFHEVAQTGFVVVEGAGGLLVPLNSRSFIIDLPAEWCLPVLLVAEDRLGAINQTLLSIEACRARGIDVLGVIWNLATKDFGNAETVTEVSGVRSLARFPKSTAESVVAHMVKHSALNVLFHKT